MNMKDKIKTFVVGAVTTILTSCGLGNGGEDKKAPNDEIMRPSAEWSTNPVKLALGKNDTILISEDAKSAINEYAGYNVFNNQTIWRGSYKSRGVCEKIAEESLKDSNISKRLAKSMKASGIEVKQERKDGTYVVVGAKYKDGKFSDPIYAKAPTVENVRNVERHEGATIHRTGVKPAEELAIDVSSIGIAKEETSTLVKEYYKVRKMIEDPKSEKSLHVGDTVNVIKAVNPRKSDGFGENETAVVEKEGVSPTYKNFERETKNTTYNFRFNYARKNLDNFK